MSKLESFIYDYNLNMDALSVLIYDFNEWGFLQCTCVLFSLRPFLNWKVLVSVFQPAYLTSLLVGKLLLLLLCKIKEHIQWKAMSRSGVVFLGVVNEGR